MVVAENGKMNRDEYRKFKIRGVEGSNDFASMHEAVLRRYRAFVTKKVFARLNHDRWR